MYRGKSLEELEDLEQNMLESEEDEQKIGYYSNLVQLYEVMYQEVRLLARKSPNDYQHYVKYIENKLLTNLRETLGEIKRKSFVDSTVSNN